MDDRLDLVFRLGFGDFNIAPRRGALDTDIGPAFGAGFKVTWADLPEANLKIGSVFQTLRIRADVDSWVPGRAGWASTTRRSGVALRHEGGMDPKKRTPQFALMPYGGFAWSGVDDFVTGGLRGRRFGLFGGLTAKARGGFNFGVELRLVDQTAVSLGASMAF